MVLLNVVDPRYELDPDPNFYPRQICKNRDPLNEQLKLPSNGYQPYNQPVTEPASNLKPNSKHFICICCIAFGEPCCQEMDVVPL